MEQEQQSRFEQGVEALRGFPQVMAVENYAKSAYEAVKDKANSMSKYGKTATAALASTGALFTGAGAAEDVASAQMPSTYDDPAVVSAKNECAKTAIYRGPDTGGYLRAVKSKKTKKYNTKTSSTLDFRLADQRNNTGFSYESCTPYESQPREFFVQELQAAKGSKQLKPNSNIVNLKVPNDVGEDPVFTARATLKLQRPHVDYYKRKKVKKDIYSKSGISLVHSSKKSTKATVAVTETVYIMGRLPQSRTTYTTPIEY